MDIEERKWFYYNRFFLDKLEESIHTQEFGNYSPMVAFYQNYD